MVVQCSVRNRRCYLSVCSLLFFCEKDIGLDQFSNSTVEFAFLKLVIIYEMFSSRTFVGFVVSKRASSLELFDKNLRTLSDKVLLYTKLQSVFACDSQRSYRF